jgi:hypothetical protein
MASLPVVLMQITDYGKNIKDYLLHEIEINTRISQQTKINIKTDIALYDALAEVTNNASPESIATAKKQLLKLKEYTHLLNGGKAAVALGKVEIAETMLGYELLMNSIDHK